MASPKVGIIDVGYGNIHSVHQGVMHCDASAVVCTKPSELLGVSHIILPGVGAFSKSMEALIATNFKDALIEHAEHGTPVLGICLGMQLLCHSSLEKGYSPGLGLLNANVRPLPTLDVNSSSISPTNIGWKPLNLTRFGNKARYVEINGQQGNNFYFVHSYHAVAEEDNQILANFDYGGHKIVAMMRRDNVTGVQFHPEKSGPTGLEFMRTFLWHLE
jgi:glutamine amidotransferase